MSDEGRWAKRVKLVDARAKLATEVLEGRHDDWKPELARQALSAGEAALAALHGGVRLEGTRTGRSSAIDGASGPVVGVGNLKVDSKEATAGGAAERSAPFVSGPCATCGHRVDKHGDTGCTGSELHGCGRCYCQRYTALSHTRPCIASPVFAEVVNTVRTPAGFMWALDPAASGDRFRLFKDTGGCVGLIHTHPGAKWFALRPDGTVLVCGPVDGWATAAEKIIDALREAGVVPPVEPPRPVCVRCGHTAEQHHHSRYTLCMVDGCYCDHHRVRLAPERAAPHLTLTHPPDEGCLDCPLLTETERHDRTIGMCNATQGERRTVSTDEVALCAPNWCPLRTGGVLVPEAP